MFRTAEIFAGIGGVTCGFADTGVFQPTFLHDADPVARRALIANELSLTNCYELGDVQNLRGSTILEYAGGPLDGLLGCPPCQGLSPAGLRRNDDDRNALLREFHRLVRSTNPSFFVLENVPNLLSTSLFHHFMESLADRYCMATGVLNAAEYGVPQLRRRAVVIAIKKTLGVEPSLPTPTHGGSGTVFSYRFGSLRDVQDTETRTELGLSPSLAGCRQLVTLSQALSDLDSPNQLVNARYRSPPKSKYQRFMREFSDCVVRNHHPWRHRRKTVERIALTPPGDCPTSYGDRHRNRRYFSQAYSRLHGDGLSRTITTNFHNPGSGRFTHYEDPRSLTVREALRIQGFRDDFEFGPDIYYSDAKRLVGNAFPRPLSKAIGMHLARLLH